jgi:hypothetical protein
MTTLISSKHFRYPKFLQHIRSSNLQRFPPDEVASIANLLVGKGENEDTFSEAHFWLRDHADL